MITQLRIGSITFNDNFNYVIDGTPGLDMPQMRIINYNLSGEHFGIFVSSFYGKRRFSLTGWVGGATISDFIAKRDALLVALDITSQVETTLYFTLANGRQIQINAVAVVVDMSAKPGEITATRFNIAFEASFPFLLGQNLNSQNIQLATGGGTQIPFLTMPFGISSDQGGKIFAVNNGNAPYYPFVRIYGPVTNPAVKNNTTGKQIRLQITLPTGQYVDLDFKRKTIVDNQGLNQYATKSGDWWFLQPGTNDIRFLADVYNSSSLCNFQWRDSYLGI